MIGRRKFLSGATAGGGLLLAGCDTLNQSDAVKDVLKSANSLTYRTQRLIVDRNSLAREFSRADMSPTFRANGTTNPTSPSYRAHVAAGFADWRLAVTGAVRQPLAISLPQLLAMPQRTQITRHDCVEGWSAIGEWTGVPLGHVLRLAGLTDAARFIVFECADTIGATTPYYESVDLVDAFHPQTILAHRLNGQTLPVANGAPLRVRIERQLGYKHAKYLTGIRAVPTLAGIGRGKGGAWEDVAGYEWYAGL